MPRCAPTGRLHHLLTAGLGDEVVAEVIEVRGGTVRLEVDAPRSPPVYREEHGLEVKRKTTAAGEAVPEVAVRLR